MKAALHTPGMNLGTIHVAERPTPTPAAGEVRVEVHVSGVNPTDVKARANSPEGLARVPNQDGSGVVDAVGEGVDPELVGQRVWLWEAAWKRLEGSAQEYVCLPARQAVPFPEHVSFDVGASLGIPALTAHRALTLAPDGPRRLGPGALSGKTVLVAGGAGVVGNSAIQLARWSGAQVISTVSSTDKGLLATSAGAHHVLNYRAVDVAEAVREIAPRGVELIVEVAPGANAKVNRQILGTGGVVGFYSTEGGAEFQLPATDMFLDNQAWHGIFVYTVPQSAKDSAVSAISAAVADGALRVGTEAGLPLHRFSLDRVAEAHQAVADTKTVGKVLVDVRAE
ncbi:NADPH:quinone reductase [Lentzea cavernae]|uniref:NADPH:quinone reductase n=1 Tax=Lentzea cavernae TaxID=2020703 RepID=A0ABQ3M2X1_9PSEU|nr:NADPH:quinone reductase [Lentzea cavernae]GHH32351.1 NADPH:quinone reductase [Lentzea cavernae]